MSENAAPATKTVLITGTSSGVGLAAAVAAARAGYAVVATVRDLGRTDALREAADAAGVELDIRRLDVTEPDSIEETISGVLHTHGRLDAVVNNAGVGSIGTLELLSLDQIRFGMEVNFFGVLAVSRAALPHLRAAGGRLITVGSAYGSVGQPFNEAYCAGKAATETYMEALAAVAAEVGVTVSVVQPGPIASSFGDNMPIDRVALRAAADAGQYKAAYANYLEYLPGMIAGAVQTSAEVAEYVVYALTDPAPPFRIQTSDFSRSFVADKLHDVDGSAVQAITRQWLAPANTGVNP
ncbi:SDR family NAD(P)-dependent oxidoreductase [Nocardia sp. NPDC052254]|uniref:SDR family NAD(P)-dependent oxidoreductase n=1 Tax=Nocardia sp. NPDC052254 TaxID=3155681 RepID=UPI003449BE62